MTRLEDSFLIFLSKVKNNENVLLLVEEITTKNREFLKLVAKDEVEKKTSEEFIANYLSARKIQTTTQDRDKILSKIQSLEGTILKTALEQAVINLCSIYEEYLRRVILKYYEDDVTRLGSAEKTLSDQDIVDTIQSGYNIHRVLAEKFVGAPSLFEAHAKLKEILGSDFYVDPLMHEMRLIRNALVHNGGRATSKLASNDGKRFRTNKVFGLTMSNFSAYKDIVFKTAQYIQRSFSEGYPDKGTDWQVEYFESKDK